MNSVVLGAASWAAATGSPRAASSAPTNCNSCCSRCWPSNGPHGYELIRRLEERSGGFYTPSPGMIYPALTYLDEIGHAAASAEGNRKLYAITEAGRTHLAAHGDRAERILLALARIGGRMADVREAFAGLQDADPQAADDLHEARHALKHALMRKRGSGPEESRRIARILARTTAEILGKPE